MTSLINISIAKASFLMLIDISIAKAGFLMLQLFYWDGAWLLINAKLLIVSARFIITLFSIDEVFLGDQEGCFPWDTFVIQEIYKYEQIMGSYINFLTKSLAEIN